MISRARPWFVSPVEPLRALLNPAQPLPLPHDTPHHLRKLHSELSASPFLEPSSLLVTRPSEPLPGDPLPARRSKGSRRKRAGTEAGIGIDMPGSGLWSWFILAQVKEGTEAKGSINRVAKIVRKSLKQLALGDSSFLPPKRKQSYTDGWAMLDAGDFAVHILSRDARNKWFSTHADVISRSR